MAYPDQPQSSTSLKTVVVAFSIVSFFWAAWTILYRLRLHPLAKFPGPKLAATTKWYEFYYDIFKGPGGQFFRELSRMHDEYGPIVRPNPDEIHIRDPSWYHVLYEPNPTKRHKYPPATAMAGLPLGTHGTVDHDLHRRRRMANSAMFSKRAIARAHDLVRQHIRILIQIFEDQVEKGEPLVLQTIFLAHATDVIYDFMFDIKSGYQQNAEARENWSVSTKAVAQATPLLKQFPWLTSTMFVLPEPVMEWLLSHFAQDVAGLLSTHQGMAKRAKDHMRSRDQIIRSEKLGDSAISEPRTLFHAIDASNLPPEQKTLDRLTQEGVTVLVAGSETTARLLSHTIFHLLDNPSIIEKIRQEVNSVMGSQEHVPDAKVLEALPWLNASLRESLRLRAATTSRLPLVAERDLVYKDWVIPAGTPISMSHPDILLNDDIYPEASKFKPERWFNATEQQNRMFIPFGKGTRMCVGYDFAYSEMYMTLAALIARFDLELYETTWERDVAHVRDCFLGEAEKGSFGIRVKVTKDRNVE